MADENGESKDNEEPKRIHKNSAHGRPPYLPTSEDEEDDDNPDDD